MKNNTPTWEEWQNVDTEILLNKYGRKIRGWLPNSGKCNEEERLRYIHRKNTVLHDAEKGGKWCMDLLEHLLRLESEYIKKQLGYFHSNTRDVPHRKRIYQTIRYGEVVI